MLIVTKCSVQKVYSKYSHSACTESVCVLSSLSADYFIGFGKCLGKDEAELGKVWEEALGRYDRAVLNLVVDVLQEAQNPAEKLYNALEEMRTPESAKRASEAIQQGTKLQYTHCTYRVVIIEIFVFHSSAL